MSRNYGQHNAILHGIRAAEGDVLLAWTKRRFGGVTVRDDERKRGVSGYTFGKLITHAVTMYTGFSVLPLRFSALLGVVFSGFGFAWELMLWFRGCSMKALCQALRFLLRSRPSCWNAITHNWIGRGVCWQDFHRNNASNTVFSA